MIRHPDGGAFVEELAAARGRCDSLRLAFKAWAAAQLRHTGPQRGQLTKIAMCTFAELISVIGWGAA